MRLDGHTIYKEIMREDQGRRELRIREIAESVVSRRWEGLPGNRVDLPWSSWSKPRNYGITSMGMGGTLPEPGECTFLTVTVDIPPIGDAKVAQLVVERQIREQLWKANA